MTWFLDKSSSASDSRREDTLYKKEGYRTKRDLDMSDINIWLQEYYMSLTKYLSQFPFLKQTSCVRWFIKIPQTNDMKMNSSSNLNVGFI